MNADITAGAVHGSTSLTVTCTGAADGQAINAWRGLLWLGSGTITAGTVTFAVTALAKGDVIQCSAGDRGQNVGLPVLVVADLTPPTGWQQAETVTVNGDELTAAEYTAQYGHAPLASYDPAAVVPVMAPELVDSRQPTFPAPSIAFDITSNATSGSTTVNVDTVQYITGGVLVRFAPGDAWASATSKTVTADTTLTIDVKGTGDPDTRYARKTIAVTVYAPPTAPAASDILGVSFEYGSASNRLLTVLANSYKDLEVRVDGFDATWQAMTRYDVDRLNRTFGPLPTGTFTIQVRVAGDTTSSRWRSISVSR